MIAVDTNILVYAVDAAETAKGPKALALLKQLQPQNTLLLWQVVCEFGAALLRRRLHDRDRIGIPEVLNAWLSLFPLVTPSPSVIPAAWRLRDAHQLSYWDALLLGACIEAGVTRLYSEDIQSKPVIEGVSVINPFEV